jgi:iron complex transport system substrate-binding protein
VPGQLRVLAVLVAGVLVGHAPPLRAGDADGERVPHWHRAGAAVSSSKTQRIVSLAPVVTETLAALGAFERVVGVTRFCDVPGAAKQLPKVGGFIDASLEAILALRPDLVVAMPSLGQRALLDRLSDRGIAVFVVFADRPSETRAMFEALGVVVGDRMAGQRLAARQDETLALLAARRRAAASTASGSTPRTVAVVVGTDPLVIAGPGTFADVAVRATGVASAVRDGDPQWPQWSLESVLARDVGIVIAAEGPTAARRVRALLGPLGPRAPVVLAADRAILMRPGPSFVEDALAVEELLAAPVARP